LGFDCARGALPAKPGAVLRQARSGRREWTCRNDKILRRWVTYFKLIAKLVLKYLDCWIRRKLRCVVWRQWKRPYKRAENLMCVGLPEERCFRLAFSQRGHWSKSGARHMSAAHRKSYPDRLGLVSLLATTRRLQRLA